VWRSPTRTLPTACTRFLADLLAAAKSDSQEKLSSKIAEMQIPDYENWFTRTYGQERGPALASSHGKSSNLSEQHFEMLWVELAKEEGEISIGKPLRLLFSLIGYPVRFPRLSPISRKRLLEVWRTRCDA